MKYIRFYQDISAIGTSIFDLWAHLLGYRSYPNK